MDKSELHKTSRDTLMGRLLRTFWQPIARADSVANGAARALRVMGEDLTLYRGESGKAHLIGGRCAHRCTVLHTGWIQGDDLRCMYHGWKYDALGHCIEIPAEKKPRSVTIRIAAYPVHEYCGLVFAYMGEGAPPEFELPRKHVLEEPGRVLVIQEQIWDCNWLQQIENSLDAVHVSFVHIWGKSTRFDQGITTSVPELEYSETDAGIRQVATRSKDNVRVSDWTFPNNNHVVAPGMHKGDPWSDISVWAVPIDDQRTMRYTIHSFHASTAASARELGEGPDRDYDPADHYEELFNQHRASDVHDMQFISAQDYVAVRGQGTIVDRESENLSSSDAGIMLIRKIFWREMQAIRLGQPTKQWRRLQHKFDLPVPAVEAAY